MPCYYRCINWYMWPDVEPIFEVLDKDFQVLTGNLNATQLKEIFEGK